MTKSPDNLCACGCGLPARPRSKYFDEKHQQKAARIKQRDYDRAYQEAHRRTARSTYPAIRKVVIYDPKCADPYQVPRSEFEEFKSKGVEFISLTQNINTNTPEGKMFWQMLGVFAEYERELIVARTLAGLQRARRQGKALGRPLGAKDRKRRRLSGYIARWNGSKQYSPMF